MPPWRPSTTRKKNLDLSQRVYVQTRKKYEQGLGSNLEITNALTDQRTAQSNYFTALYNAICRPGRLPERHRKTITNLLQENIKI